MVTRITASDATGDVTPTAIRAVIRITGSDTTRSSARAATRDVTPSAVRGVTRNASPDATRVTAPVVVRDETHAAHRDATHDTTAITAPNVAGDTSRITTGVTAPITAPVATRQTAQMTAAIPATITAHMTALSTAANTAHVTGGLPLRILLATYTHYRRQDRFNYRTDDRSIAQRPTGIYYSLRRSGHRPRYHQRFHCAYRWRHRWAFRRRYPIVTAVNTTVKTHAIPSDRPIVSRREIQVRNTHTPSVPRLPLKQTEGIGIEKLKG
ncbi:MAG TPA: hypothetical protein VHE61_08760 [Opitutaceae bacterium]|nr:hypothetical protein [Opitutaceae bacterium]